MKTFDLVIALALALSVGFMIGMVGGAALTLIKGHTKLHHIKVMAHNDKCPNEALTINMEKKP